jgi:hypothetical protein
VSNGVPFESLGEGKAVAFQVEDSEIAKAPGVAYRLALQVRAFGMQLGVECVGVGDVELG